MKKLLIILPLLFLAVISAAIYWRYGRAQDPYTIAQALMEKGDFPGAQLELRNAVRNAPQNAAAHYRLGQLNLRLGDPVAAEKELKTARDLGMDARTLTPLLAQSYMAQGHYRELLRDFPAQGLPNDQAGPLLVFRALSQLSINDVPAAESSAAEAERLAPQSPDAQMASARVAIAKGDFTTAEQKVDRALQINPRGAEPLLLKGQLQNLKGDRTRALEAFDAAITMSPDMIPARLERANLLLVTGDYKRAREDVDRVIKLEPRSAMALYLQSALMIESKDYAGADADLTKIETLLPRFPRGYYMQAVTKYNLGQGEQATDAAIHYLSRNPNDPDAIKLFARIELAARRTPRAIDVLTKAIGGGASDPDLLDLLGRAYLLAGKPDQAVLSFERAASLSPDNAEILTRLAEARLTLGDAGRATADLEHALKLSPDQKGTAAALVVAAISAGDIERAALALAQLHTAEGDTETFGNLTAMLKMAQLDLDGATTTLVDLIKKFPDAIQPRINLAKVLTLEDKSGEAQKTLAEVLTREPANIDALNRMETLLLADGQIDKAIAVMETAHASVPKNVDVTVNLINLYGRARKLDKATALVAQALKDLPDSATLLTAKARLQLAQGQNDAARDTFRQVLDQTPTDINTRRSLSDLLMASNDSAGAKKVLTDGLKEQPGDPVLLQSYVGLVLRADGLDAALAAADQLAADPTNLPAGRTLRGDIYMAAARFTDAAAAYDGELKTAPTVALVLRLANALNAGGRTADASQVLRSWLISHPDDAIAAAALGALDIVGRRFFDAETHLQIVLKQHPSDAAALNNLAWVYQQRGDARARATAQKAYLIAPTAQASDTLGWILTTDGKASDALALLRQAAALLPDDPTVRYHLAAALQQTGHRDDAIGMLRQALGGLQDFDDRNSAQKLLDQMVAGK